MGSQEQELKSLRELKEELVEKQIRAASDARRLCIEIEAVEAEIERLKMALDTRTD